MKSNPLPVLSIGQASDPGRKRGGEPNQDAILVIPAENGHPPLFMVADGMGGHAAGDEASRLVVAAVATYYRQAGMTDNLTGLLQACLQFSLNTLMNHASDHPELASLGSTAVLAVPTAGQVFIANVGDSRAYRLRYKNSPGPIMPRKRGIFGWLHREKLRIAEEESAPEILQLTYDHSVVAELVRAGQLTPEQALQSPQRNRLTQSITPLRPEMEPYINQYPFLAGDTLLLCSDGLWGVVPEATFAAIALDLPPQEAADKLVQQAINYGGPDNISVIIVRYG